MAKKRKLKKGVVVAIGATAGIAVLAGVIGIASTFSKPKRQETPTTTSPYLSDSDMEEILNNMPDSQLNMGDFKIPQGEQIIITVNGSDVSENLIYNSSNEEVVIVDPDGTITAVAPGTASVTVTNGNKSESVVVEVTEGEDDPGENNLPLYSEAIRPTQPQETEKATITQQQTGAEQGKQESSKEELESQETQKQTQESTKQEQSSEQRTEEETTQRATESATQNTQEQTTKPTTTVKPLGSADMYGKLEGLGFKKKVANAFVFESDGEYTGQIILGNKSVHIYVKKFTPGYETALREVLKLMLPTGYEQVLRSYSSTRQDTALVSDGKKIQVIVNSGEEHRQIIVYENN